MVTFEVTGTRLGIMPATPRMPASRSWSTMPWISPTFATL
jgi:hypothetical protein